MLEPAAMKRQLDALQKSIGATGASRERSLKELGACGSGARVRFWALAHAGAGAGPVPCGWARLGKARKSLRPERKAMAVVSGSTLFQNHSREETARQ